MWYREEDYISTEDQARTAAQWALDWEGQTGREMTIIVPTNKQCQAIAMEAANLRKIGLEAIKVTWPVMHFPPLTTSLINCRRRTSKSRVSRRGQRARRR